MSTTTVKFWLQAMFINIMEANIIGVDLTFWPPAPGLWVPYVMLQWGSQKAGCQGRHKNE